MNRYKIASGWIIMLSLSILAAAQQDGGLSSLVLNETTVSQVTERYGPPVSDKLGSLDADDLNNRLSAQRKEKVFRQLEYRTDEYRHVRFTFLETKLVMIDLEYKKRLPVSSLPTKFSAVFEPFVSYSVLSSRYPTSYRMVGASKTSLIFAQCNSEQGGTSAGVVVRTKEVSRTLEKENKHER